MIFNTIDDDGIVSAGDARKEVTRCLAAAQQTHDHEDYWKTFLIAHHPGSKFMLRKVKVNEVK